jgi:O-antigen/teichoic acid export membrane protein
VASEASTARSSVAVSVSFLLASGFSALLAILIAVIVGEGAETDGFLAAYSIYLTFILFGSTLRVALVPLLGSTADEGAFRTTSADRVRRLVAVAGVAALVLLATSPLLGQALVPEATHRAKETAIVSVAILSLAAFCQIWSAALSAVLGAARRFVASGFLYVLSSATTVGLSALLMALFDIWGAAVGVLCGAVLLLATHRRYLRQFSFAVPPAWASVRDRETWKLALLAAAGASVPVALQLAATISLAAVSGRTGAVTAYSYAYFLTVLTTSVTAGVIGLVTMPNLVASLEERGRVVAREYLVAMAPFAVFLYLPLAAAYCVFGRPLLDTVLGDALSAGTIDILWDASRIFLAMGLGWVLLSPLTTLALSLRLYGGLAFVCAGVLVIHAALVIPAATVGPVTAAGAHAISGTILVIGILVLVFRGESAGALAAAVRASLPAAPLALVFPALGALGLADNGSVSAVAGVALGGALYAVLGITLWPSVGGRALQLLRA